MVIKLNSTSGGASSIGYGLTKKRDIQQADNILAKQNENVLFIRADRLKVNSVLDTPMPSNIYRQMQLRQQVAGMKRKDKFWNIKICPSKEDWKALLGFELVPGKVTDEQKTKVLEVANKLIDASIEKLDATDHHGYRRNKKGEKYTCITGKHTNLADSQAVWSVHFDTDDIHIHGTANMVTEHNKVQEANMCIDRGFVAGDKVAEKFGLKQLSKYDNQRKKRIHADGISVLKGMKEFNLQTYFAEMMAKGWIIDPNTADRNGVIHGYSVGEKLYHNDGSLSSVIMFKSSELGHSKDLTPSNILQTWQKVRAEKMKTVTSKREEQPKRTATVIPIEQKKPGRWSEEGRRLREEEHKKTRKVEPQNRENIDTRKHERKQAISDAVVRINEYGHRKDRIFTEDEILHISKGVVARCLDNEMYSFNIQNLKNALKEFKGDMNLMPFTQDTVVTDASRDILEIYITGLLAALHSTGGPGGPNNDLPKDKDDQWDLWKALFGMRPPHRSTGQRQGRKR